MRKVSALIVADAGEVDSSVATLSRLLLALGVPVVRVSSLTDIDYGKVATDNGVSLDPDTAYIFFRNPLVRYPKLSDLVEFLRQDGNSFSNVWSGRDLVAMTENHFMGKGGSFHLSGFPVTYEKPDVAPVRIMTYAHRRADYFKLSLTSLLYALEGDDEVMLDIVLSAPTTDVERIARDAATGRRIRVFRSDNNLGVAAVNLWLQVVKPESFMLFEEDYILPQHVRHLLPFWPRQIAHRLKSNDMVFFQTSMDNLPWDFHRTDVHRRPGVPLHPFDHRWEQNPAAPNVTGNGMAANTAYYASFPAQPPNYINGDGYLFERAKRTSVSSVRGYHIGWNQEMDGHPKLMDATRFPVPEPIQSITDCATGEKFTVDLREFHKLV